MSGGVSNLLGYSQKGTEFLFGKLATPEIGGSSFAIAALPVIIFFASAHLDPLLSRHHAVDRALGRRRDRDG